MSKKNGLTEKCPKRRPLPSGRAVTNQEVLSTAIPEDYMTPDLRITLVDHYIDPTKF